MRVNLSVHGRLGQLILNKTRRHIRFGACLAVVGMSLSLPLSSQSRAVEYSLTDLGDLPGGLNSSVATGLNNHGAVVGYSQSASGERAFRWTREGGMLDLGDLPGGADNSRANDINDDGQVVGRSSVAEGPNDVGVAFHAFSWTATGGMQDLGVLPGALLETSESHAINNNGRIVGWSDSLPGDRAFWGAADNPQLYPFNAPESDDEFIFSVALSTNTQGHSVGEVQFVGIFTDTFVTRAYFWDDVGGMQDLGVLPGFIDSYATSINDLGLVVGSCYSAEGIVEAFLWSSGTGMQGLGSLPGGSRSSALDINNLGQVVGSDFIESSQTTEAFLWTSGAGFINLNSALDATGDGWRLVRASAINEQGQIVGYGINPDGFTHAFLLTPVPEPSGGALVLWGLVLPMLLMIRARRTSANSRPPIKR